MIDCLHICLSVLPVPSSKELKDTKVGKLVNKIAKLEKQKEVTERALDVVQKWKKELSRCKQEERARKERLAETRIAVEEIRVEQKVESHNSNTSTGSNRRKQLNSILSKNKGRQRKMSVRFEREDKRLVQVKR